MVAERAAQPPGMVPQVKLQCIHAGDQMIDWARKRSPDMRERIASSQQAADGREVDMLPVHSRTELPYPAIVKPLLSCPFLLMALSRARSFLSRGRRKARNKDKWAEQTTCSDKAVPSNEETMHDISKYEYVRLEDEHIRLLELHPAKNIEDPLECRLVPVPWEDAGEYVAISYVWGDPNIRAPMICEQRLVEVTINLRDALRRFRSPNKACRLWADAICINQNDVEEKTKQVQMMGRIYWQAKQVNVWLGNVRTGELPTLETMRDILAIYLDDLEEFGSTEKIPLRPAEELLQEQERWETMRLLFSQPWFKRVWVVQEVGLAHDVRYYFGYDDISAFSGKDFDAFMQFMNSSGQTMSRYFRIDPQQYYLVKDYQVAVFDNARIRFGEESVKCSNRFLDLLSGTRSLQCTDRRDAVYAFLGHPAAYKDSWSFVGASERLVEPEYDITPEVLFFNLAIRCIEQETDGIGLLLHVENEPDFLESPPTLEVSSQTRIRLGEGVVGEMSPFVAPFPSWIPRWGNLSTFAQPIGQNSAEAYHACGTYVERIPCLDENLPHLTIDAVRLSEVIYTWAFPGPSAFLVYNSIATVVKSTTPDRELNPVEYLWMDFSKKRQEMGNERRNDVLSFCITLTAGLRRSQWVGEDWQIHFGNFCAYRLAKAEVWSPELSEPLKKTLREYPGMADEYFLDVQYACAHRVFFATTTGHIGLGPAAVREGDVCWLPKGSPMPFMLRPNENGCFQVVGPVYLHGVMQGEATDGIGSDDFESVTLV